MKKWETPVIDELNIKETAYHCVGADKDGGYVGDGKLSGHQSGIDFINPNGKCDICGQSL